MPPIRSLSDLFPPPDPRPCSPCARHTGRVVVPKQSRCPRAFALAVHRPVPLPLATHATHSLSLCKSASSLPFSTKPATTAALKILTHRPPGRSSLAQHRSPPTPRTVVDYVFALPPPPPASAQAPVPSIAAAERVKEHWDGSLTWGGPVLSTVAVSQQAKHRTTLGPGNSNSLKIEHRYSNKCLVNVHSRTRLTVAQEVGPIRRSTDE